MSKLRILYRYLLLTVIVASLVALPIAIVYALSIGILSLLNNEIGFGIVALMCSVIAWTMLLFELRWILND